MGKVNFAQDYAKPTHPLDMTSYRSTAKFTEMSYMYVMGSHYST